MMTAPTGVCWRRRKSARGGAYRRRGRHLLGELYGFCERWRAIKVAEEQMAALNLKGDEFHPDWNYSISPRGQIVEP
jgi:hypothetical protein